MKTQTDQLDVEMYMLIPTHPASENTFRFFVFSDKERAIRMGNHLYTTGHAHNMCLYRVDQTTNFTEFLDVLQHNVVLRRQRLLYEWRLMSDKDNSK